MLLVSRGVSSRYSQVQLRVDARIRIPRSVYDPWDIGKGVPRPLARRQTDRAIRRSLCEFANFPRMRSYKGRRAAGKAKCAQSE